MWEKVTLMGVAHSGGIAGEEKRIRWLQLAAAAKPRAHFRVEVVAAAGERQGPRIP